ncbi:AAA family ATPase [Nonomuraea sp. NPDC050478]|uniref:helix-turn-helix transcriptional regulator n=1 Tax=Nonomuraea sp. NPDC050478 TaxID=3364365 RepID=UPI0037959083
MLYGRATEIAAIQGVIDAAPAGAGEALLLRGEAGIGKSALLDLAATLAGPRLTVLRAWGVEAEADLAFAALHQLLRPVTGLLDALPAPQRQAVAGALGLAAPAEDRFLVAAGVLSLLAEAAEDGGVLCLVDDLQWLDRASADALLFAARRVRTERVGMLLAVRGDGVHKGVPELRLRGLDDESAATLVDSLAPSAPPVRARLVSLTGGNPLVLGETLASLSPDQLAGRLPLPDPLPGGAQLFGDQVTRLSAPARRVLLAASLEPDLTLTLRTASLLDSPVRTQHEQPPTETETPADAPARATTPPEMETAARARPNETTPSVAETDVRAWPNGDGPSREAPARARVTEASVRAPARELPAAVSLREEVALAGLYEAEKAGLVVVDGAAVRFRHPLVRSAVHGAAGPVEVRRAHAVLAELVEGDRRAWHLAAAAMGRDEPVAAALAAAADGARARGGYGDAATALGRAAELTPDPWTRARRYTDAATAAWLGGRPGQAQTYLAEAHALTQNHPTHTPTEPLHETTPAHQKEGSPLTPPNHPTPRPAPETGDERPLAHERERAPETEATSPYTVHRPSADARDETTAGRTPTREQEGPPAATPLTRFPTGGRTPARGEGPSEAAPLTRTPEETRAETARGRAPVQEGEGSAKAEATSPHRANRPPADARDETAGGRSGPKGFDGLRREIRQLRGRFELNSGDAAEAVRILAGGDSMEMLADAAEAANYVGDIPALVEIGRRALAHPPGFLRDVVAGIGARLDDGGGAELLRGALARTGELREAAEFLWASAAASYLGEADVSAELVGRAGRVARVSGMVGQLPVVLEFVSTGERLRGRLAESEAVAEEGLALAREAGYTNSEAAHLANLAVVAALRGQEESCREHARRALAIAVPHRVGLRAGVASYALAMLDLGLGRYDAAHARFTALAAAGHPTVVWRTAPDRVEAAVAAGEPEAAREALDGLERWAANAGTPESRASLLRCRALVDGDAALFEEAARLHGEPFEAARTALLHGERLRRTHRPGQARGRLRSALETFTRLRAEPWARRASGELRAAGEAAGDVPEADPAAALTPQELRIARLVAEGASSKDVAARLFLSPRTVEYHLYKIYPKLGITSRTELARLL